jgi:hypothetical protein
MEVQLVGTNKNKKIKDLRSRSLAFMVFLELKVNFYYPRYNFYTFTSTAIPKYVHKPMFLNLFID